MSLSWPIHGTNGQPSWDFCCCCLLLQTTPSLELLKIWTNLQQTVLHKRWGSLSKDKGEDCRFNGCGTLIQHQGLVHWTRDMLNDVLEGFKQRTALDRCPMYNTETQHKLETPTATITWHFARCTNSTTATALKQTLLQWHRYPPFKRKCFCQLLFPHLCAWAHLKRYALQRRCGSSQQKLAKWGDMQRYLNILQRITGSLVQWCRLIRTMNQ